ncbi:nitrogen regulatory IIA protein [Chryseobacterium scophthalmum]|uniref:nitrogen regulatory IIA protein n=1 Tax=Chryseobacterium scophthalmum TaxID=59733 RepID=UPI003CFE12A9
MKKFRSTIDQFVKELELRWASIPVKKQQRYTLSFFSGYAMLTVGIIFHVIIYQTGKPRENVRIEKSKIVLKDSLSVNLKNKFYERDSK